MNFWEDVSKHWEVCSDLEAVTDILIRLYFNALTAELYCDGKVAAIFNLPLGEGILKEIASHEAGKYERAPILRPLKAELVLYLINLRNVH